MNRPLVTAWERFTVISDVFVTLPAAAFQSAPCSGSPVSLFTKSADHTVPPGTVIVAGASPADAVNVPMLHFSPPP